ncbi:MAG: ribonuclease P protein component [Rhodoferax sp.]|nr:ribonuclease P protein component [Rhodoferax sp.]
MQRLKTRAQFQAVMAGGIVSRTAHFVLHRSALESLMPAPPTSALAAAPEPPSGTVPVCEVWMGALVPKRWAKRAVMRNAIKRQIYSVSADFEPRLAVAAHVVRLRTGFDRAQFISATSRQLKQAVRTELQQLFGKALAPSAAAGVPA